MYTGGIRLPTAVRAPGVAPLRPEAVVEYDATMQAAVLILMAVVVGVLIYTLIRLGKSDYTYLADRMADRTRDRFEVLKPCPLCSTMLRRGETVHSVVFSGPARSESLQPGTATAASAARSRRTPEEAMAHIFGCPYCYPPNAAHRRVCPVCNQVVPDDGYVIARMFEKPGRKHVHVLGCTLCRTPSGRASGRTPTA